MGAVYEADDVELRRRVAIKVLFDSDAKSIARFREEATAAASLRHRGIVEVIAVQVEGDAPFLVMERVDGESLATVLRREGPLSPARAVAIAREILSALGAAHAAGIVHRDVKPANVLLARPLQSVKLVDFGIAKRLDGGGVKTTTGAMIGTPAYLAPEQVRGEAVDPRSDVWAVGVCLHEMLAGARPFRRPAPELYEEILLSEPSALPPTVPPALAAVVMRALAKDPHGRFATAAAMEHALAATVERARVRGKRRWTSVVVFVGAGIAPLAIAALALRGFRTTDVASIPRAPVAPMAVPPREDAARAADEADGALVRGDADAVLVVARAGPARVPCVCVAAVGPRRSTLLCQKVTPKCVCVIASGGWACPTPPQSDGTCANFQIAKGKHDDPCEAWVYDGEAGTTRVAGSLTCTSCSNEEAIAQRRLEVPGTPCRGLWSEGDERTGVWRAVDGPRVTP